MITRLIVLGFILAVIGAEGLIACFYLPTVAASGTTDSQAHGEKEAAHAVPGHESQAPPQLKREVDLGKFSLTAYQPASNSSVLIDFHLFGTVAVEPGHHDEEAASSGGHGGGHGGGEAKPNDEFSRLYDKSMHRIRDQVITIVRSADLTDFADPNLGLIRRKILEKSNRILGKPLLQEVIFSDFSLVEQ